MSDGVEIRRVFATEAAAVRAIRLRALDDPVAGIAFLESRSDAVARSDAFWTDSAVGAALGDGAAQFIADDRGRWVGTVTVLLPVPGTVDDFGRVHPEGHSLLVAVFIEPDHRGSGLLAELVRAAAAWAKQRGGDAMLLDVHEDNARARAAYRRLGFAPTGQVWTGPNGREVEMVRGGHGAAQHRTLTI